MKILIPVVSFVAGKSNVGKTTLLEKVIKEFKCRGYKVAVLKHDVHWFDLYPTGKDEWRYSQSGSQIVVTSSLNKIVYTEHVTHELSVDEVIKRISGVDIILVEGYKLERLPKVEIYRQEVCDKLFCSENELLAVVTDIQLPVCVPQFSLSDASGIVSFLEQKYSIMHNAL
ncbi:MAG: molybdopterin-guanine dinucleotide biosynthesis protein B [Peptococcaceae bacterium]|nr:molybdopterin-guanine dinucleotide biosynthesis protein B [Peptococcaceae bacterium]